MKPANRSYSSKTPSQTPGERQGPAELVRWGQRGLGCLPVSVGLWGLCQAALVGFLVRQEEVGYAARLLGITHLLPT